MLLGKSRLFSVIFGGAVGLSWALGPVYSSVFKYEYRTVLINKNTPECVSTITSFIQMHWLMSIIILLKIYVFSRAFRGARHQTVGTLWK